MITNGFERLHRTARRIRNRFGPRGLILLYHRVISLPSDPHLLCVTPQHFAQHLEVLRQRYQVVPLRQMAGSLHDGKLPRRSVAITFDDGYADNLHNARPLLERYDIPATVFVASGCVDQSREFWWDELERLLLEPRDLPRTLQFSIDGFAGNWALGEAAHYDDDTDRRHNAWNVEQKDPGPRQQIFRELYGAVFHLPSEEQQQALAQLQEWAGAGCLCRPTHRPLSSDELVDLADGGLVEIGAHTVTHLVLSSAPTVRQQWEIRQSKTHLEEILGQPVTGFSYPYGLRSTYTTETVAAVREAGFTSACSNFPDLVGKKTDPYQLPRLVVQDWDGETFGRELEHWLGKGG